MTGLLVLIGANVGFDPKEAIAASNMLMDEKSFVSSEGNFYETVLGIEISRDSIVTITFMDTLDLMADTAWDVSKEQNGMVFAWTEPNSSNDKGLNLFIGAKGKIEAKIVRVCLKDILM